MATAHGGGSSVPKRQLSPERGPPPHRPHSPSPPGATSAHLSSGPTSPGGDSGRKEGGRPHFLWWPPRDHSLRKPPGSGHPAQTCVIESGCPPPAPWTLTLWGSTPQTDEHLTGATYSYPFILFRTRARRCEMTSRDAPCPGPSCLPLHCFLILIQQPNVFLFFL